MNFNSIIDLVKNCATLRGKAKSAKRRIKKLHIICDNLLQHNMNDKISNSQANRKGSN